ncbi:MAG: metalloregulator ArsR/SmtB family transcription factor [archaeon]
MSKDLKVFRALGEMTKHRILKELVKGEKCACELPAIAKTTQPNCSMHLAKLSEWGLVKSRRDGRKVLYSIKDERITKILSIAGGKRK